MCIIQWDGPFDCLKKTPSLSPVWLFMYHCLSPIYPCCHKMAFMISQVETSTHTVLIFEYCLHLYMLHFTSGSCYGYASRKSPPFASSHNIKLRFFPRLHAMIANMCYRSINITASKTCHKFTFFRQAKLYVHTRKICQSVGE